MNLHAGNARHPTDSQSAKVRCPSFCAAALEASRALERQYAEVAEQRQALSTAFEAEKVGGGAECWRSSGSQMLQQSGRFG